MKTGLWKELQVLKSVLTAATGGGNTESSLHGLPLFSPGERVPPKCLRAPVFLGCCTKSFLHLPTHLKMYFYQRADDRGNPLVSLPQPAVHFLFFCFAFPLFLHPLIPPCIEQLRSFVDGKQDHFECVKMQ